MRKREKHLPKPTKMTGNSKSGVNQSEETSSLLVDAEEQGYTIYTRAGDYIPYTRMCGQVYRIKQGLADLADFNKETWRKKKRFNKSKEIVYKGGMREWMLGNIGYGIGSVHNQHGKRFSEMSDSEVESHRLYNRARKARTSINAGRHTLSDYDKNYRCINYVDGRTVRRKGGHTFSEWSNGNDGYMKYIQQNPRIKIADKTPEQRIHARGYSRATSAKKKIDSGERRLSDYYPDYTLNTYACPEGHKLLATSVRSDSKKRREKIRLIKTLLPEVPSWCLERYEPEWKQLLQETPEHLIFG